jgi:hypothetical protein
VYLYERQVFGIAIILFFGLRSLPARLKAPHPATSTGQAILAQTSLSYVCCVLDRSFLPNIGSLRSLPLLLCYAQIHAVGAPRVGTVNIIVVRAAFFASRKWLVFHISSVAPVKTGKVL